MKSEDKRVLITGGSVFVGQYLVEKFIDSGIKYARCIAVAVADLFS